MPEPDDFNHPLIVAAYDTLNSYDPGTQVDFYREVKRTIGSLTSVLELGCGSGIVSCALASDGHRVIEVEPAEPMLDLPVARTVGFGGCTAVTM